MFKVVVTDRALKDIDNLTQDVRRRIASTIKDYVTVPLNYAQVNRPQDWFLSIQGRRLQDYL